MAVTFQDFGSCDYSVPLASHQDSKSYLKPSFLVAALCGHRLRMSKREARRSPRKRAPWPSPKPLLHASMRREIGKPEPGMPLNCGDGKSSLGHLGRCF